MKKRIIIDGDMGSDDYIAIHLAILSKKFKIEGFSLVYGNASMDNVKNNLFKCLDDIGYKDKFKIYEGESHPIKDLGYNRKDNAFGSDGLGDVSYDKVYGIIEPINSIDWMIDTVNKNPNKISIVALGPLTNIAKAIEKDKSFANNIKELIVMGGSEGFGNITPYAEFNFYNDPYAVKTVYSAGIKSIVNIGWNIAVKVPITKEYEDLLKDSKDKNANFIYDITRKTAEIDKEYGGAIISDPITICYLLDRTCISFKDAKMNIEIIDMDKISQTIFDYNDPANCKNAVDLDKRKIYKIIFGTLFKKDKKKLKELLRR